MRNLIPRFNLILNITIAICAVVFTAVLIKSYVLPRPDEPKSVAGSPLGLGSKLNLTEFDWTKNRRTLVLALSKNCHFCSESASFYQELSQELKGQSDIHILAIFPESMPEAKDYLKQINVPIEDVRHAPLVSLGFKGTPTVLLINESGDITDLWLGKLTAEQATEVIRKVRAERDGGAVVLDEAQRTVIDAQELQRLVKTSQKVVILVRDRQTYAAGHAPGSKNIPSDELDVRAINELTPTDFILTSCSCVDAVLSTLARDRLIKSGFKKVAVLREP